ncbi:PHB depolymerase family esterase [soil metagenome]
MAVQLHVAYSAFFKGAASIAGGAWECAKGDVNRSQSVCMISPSQIDVKELAQIARDRAARGEIDDLANLAASRVAIFASPNDMVIKPLGSDKLEEFYATFLPKSAISRLTNRSAAHGFPTLAYGNKCSTMGVPWILNCNDDVAGKLLAAIEPSNRTLAARGTADPTSIIYFDQSKLVSAQARMFEWGAAYIPKVCARPGANCGVHVALHGCQMNPDFIQEEFVEHAGYNEWAESNNLVILYPQSAKGVGNPYACWDWFGFTGSNYTTKSGEQIAGIKKILADLGAK